MSDEKNAFGYSADEHEDIIAKVTRSHIEDYDGSRRRYADSVSTSEALRKRRIEGLSKSNGHYSEPSIFNYEFKPLGYKKTDK